MAENLAQLVARLSHSRFSRRNASTVVPLCMMALANIAALWHTELRTCVHRRCTRSATHQVKRVGTHDGDTRVVTCIEKLVESIKAFGYSGAWRASAEASASTLCEALTS